MRYKLQVFPASLVMYFMLYKSVVTFETVNEILKYGHSN